MASRQSRRFMKPLLYTAGAVAGGGTILYISYRPREIPGSGPPHVPPPSYTEGNKLVPPTFPYIKGRHEQIRDLKESSSANALHLARGGIEGTSSGLQEEPIPAGSENVDNGEPYDLLVIGGGATGSGIALDAATRGLKVALVERDDFSAGTSSKSTKLVHGGVRYLEKAVWELDYNQYVKLLCPRT